MLIRPPSSPLFPYTTLFRSDATQPTGDVPRARVEGGSLMQNLGLHQRAAFRSEEHTSELQSRFDLVCRLLLEKKKIIKTARMLQSLITLGFSPCCRQSASLS